MKVRLPIARSVLVTSILSMTLACGVASEDNEEVDLTRQPIVGGTEATPGAWPGTVALYQGNVQVCGGTLVADEWVLTAAHCVSPSSSTGGFSRVVINRHALSSSSGETRTVKRAIRHPSYRSSTMDNDIALLQLTTPSTAPIAKLIREDHVPLLTAGSDVTAVGWGNTSQNGSASNVLRQVTVPVIANETCSGYANYRSVTQNMICAGLPQGTKDSCQGDSGGPLFFATNTEILQVGIVSWGIGCARPNSPGVYTRVSNYLTWLEQTSEGAIGTTPDPGPEPNPGPGDEPDEEPAPGSTFEPFEESGTVSRNESRSWSYEAPAGTYTITLSGTGDADLYVRRNQAPTTSAYDCRPYTNGSNERCEVTFTSPGTLYVAVRGYASTSTFTLTGSKNP